MTYFFDESELLYKFYYYSWHYLGRLGRHVVDFVALAGLIIAAADYEAYGDKTSVTLTKIWATFGTYLGTQSVVAFLQNFYMDKAMIYTADKLVPKESSIESAAVELTIPVI